MFFLLLLIFVAISNIYGAWVPYGPMTDEFNGNALNMSKWYNTNPYWKGRQPGLFEPSNVKVVNGILQLWANYTSYPSNNGYYNYTTSAVQSKATLLYGYSELRAKLGSSKVSSAFWFYRNDATDGTEIDVFEESGPINQTAEYYHDYHENTHIVKLNGVNPADIASKCHCTNNKANSDCSDGFVYSPSFPNFSDDFHIFGVNWTETRLITYLDNKEIRNIENYCLHQSLNLALDRETMPDWWGLPRPNDLPDQPFEIDYVRTWIQQ